MTLREWIEETELDTNEGFLIDFEFASFAEPPTQVVSQPILVPGHAFPEASSQETHYQFQDVPVITPDKEPGDGITVSSYSQRLEQLPDDYFAGYHCVHGGRPSPGSSERFEDHAHLRS